MSNKKQTAVDWLVEQLLNGKALMPSMIEQAKEMEKDQIKDAWIDDRFPLDKDWVKQCAEQYYILTYGGSK
jgi:hypothetical protein